MHMVSTCTRLSVGSRVINDPQRPQLCLEQASVPLASKAGFTARIIAPSRWLDGHYTRCLCLVNEPERRARCISLVDFRGAARNGADGDLFLGKLLRLSMLCNAAVICSFRCSGGCATDDLLETRKRPPALGKESACVVDPFQSPQKKCATRTYGQGTRDIGLAVN